MLVLTRKDGEEIQIGRDVRVEVLSVSGGRVRLGITAPKEISICRSEIQLTVDEGTESGIEYACT